MAFAIKAKIANPGATTFAFAARKTMYGGKHVAEGDAIFLFAGENEAARALSRAASSHPSKRSRQSPALPGRRRA